MAYVPRGVTPEAFLAFRARLTQAIRGRFDRSLMEVREALAVAAGFPHAHAAEQMAKRGLLRRGPVIPTLPPVPLRRLFTWAPAVRDAWASPGPVDEALALAWGFPREADLLQALVHVNGGPRARAAVAPRPFLTLGEVAPQHLWGLTAEAAREHLLITGAEERRHGMVQAWAHERTQAGGRLLWVGQQTERARRIAGVVAQGAFQGDLPNALRVHDWSTGGGPDLDLRTGWTVEDLVGLIAHLLDATPAFYADEVTPAVALLRTFAQRVSQALLERPHAQPAGLCTLADLWTGDTAWAYSPVAFAALQTLKAQPGSSGLALVREMVGAQFQRITRDLSSRTPVLGGFPAAVELVILPEPTSPARIGLSRAIRRWLFQREFENYPPQSAGLWINEGDLGEWGEAATVLGALAREKNWTVVWSTAVAPHPYHPLCTQTGTRVQVTADGADFGQVWRRGETDARPLIGRPYG
jgi:hypothetical protein